MSFSFMGNHYKLFYHLLTLSHQSNLKHTRSHAVLPVMWALQDQYFVVELLSLRLYTIRSQLIVLSPEVSDNHFVKIFIPCNAMHIRIFGLNSRDVNKGNYYCCAKSEFSDRQSSKSH